MWSWMAVAAWASSLDAVDQILASEAGRFEACPAPASVAVQVSADGTWAALGSEPSAEERCLLEGLAGLVLPSGHAQQLQIVREPDRVRALLPGLARDTIAEVVGARSAAIRRCYTRRLKHRPDLGGKLVVTFTVGADGGVTACETKSSTLADDSVADCVVGVVRELVFPPVEGGGVVTASYPFSFVPDPP